MTSTTIVSIITPSFNRADVIDETAQSVFAQTYPYWEWMIVEDGSTDSSWEVLEKYAAKDKRVRIMKRERNPKGACPCRNIGVEFCVGNYVLFLDTDDLLEPFCLEQRVKAMEDNPELDFSIFPSLMFRYKPFDLNLWWNIDKPQSELVRQFHQDAICQGTGVLWKKESFIRIGQWDEQLHLWQDIDLFLRAYIQNYQYKKFFNLLPDLHNRTMETSLSRGNFLAIEKQESRIIVIKRAVDLLNQLGKQEYKREARFMLVEIISGLVRTKKYSLADKLTGWGREQEVLLPEEIKAVKWLKYIYQLKLYKFNFGKKFILKMNRLFIAERTLGVLPFKEQ